MVETLIVGDSASWSFRLTDLPAFSGAPEGATLSAFLRSAGELINLKAEALNGRIFASLDPKASAKLTVGKAFLLLRLVSEADQYQKSAVVKELQVVPAVDDEGFDHRTEAQKCLAQAEAALVDYTKGGGRVKSYIIGTRSTTFNNLQELTDLVEYWRKRVYLEACAQQGIDPRRMLVEFVP